MLQVNKKMLRAAKILERMVNQNTYDEIAQGKLAPNHITLFRRAWNGTLGHVQYKRTKKNMSQNPQYTAEITAVANCSNFLACIH